MVCHYVVVHLSFFENIDRDKNKSITQSTARVFHVRQYMGGYFAPADFRKITLYLSVRQQAEEKSHFNLNILHRYFFRSLQNRSM